MNNIYIKREILPQLLEHIKRPEITMLIGPRQAGKTTLMQQIQNVLDKQGKKTIFLNLDFPEDKAHFISLSNFIDFLNTQTPNKHNKHAYVFIDEIQRLENAGLFLKGFYDKQLPYKLIVSGSGSIELKGKIHESLAGRKLVFEIYPLSFKEFINFKTNYQYENNLDKFFKHFSEKAYSLLNEYLLFGGYPKVAIEQYLNFKIRTLKEIFTSYIQKDIQTLLRIEKTNKFILLLEFLAAYIGRTLNKTELSRHLGISINTLDKYIWYLEQTFIVKKVRPFFSNPKKELIKQPIYYFIDIGLRNWIFNKNSALSDQDGFVFQNFVFDLFLHEQSYQYTDIKYWRTKNKAEVDFILKQGDLICPVEVKNQDLRKLPNLRSLKSFIKKYHPKYAYIVNKSVFQKLKIENTTLFILPYYFLLTNNMCNGKSIHN